MRRSVLLVSLQNETLVETIICQVSQDHVSGGCSVRPMLGDFFLLFQAIDLIVVLWFSQQGQRIMLPRISGSLYELNTV